MVQPVAARNSSCRSSSDRAKRSLRVVSTGFSLLWGSVAEGQPVDHELRVFVGDWKTIGMRLLDDEIRSPVSAGGAQHVISGQAIEGPGRDLPALEDVAAEARQCAGGDRLEALLPRISVTRHNGDFEQVRPQDDRGTLGVDAPLRVVEPPKMRRGDEDRVLGGVVAR